MFSAELGIARQELSMSPLCCGFLLLARLSAVGVRVEVLARNRFTRRWITDHSEARSERRDRRLERHVRPVSQHGRQLLLTRGTMKGPCKGVNKSVSIVNLNQQARNAKIPPYHRHLLRPRRQLEKRRQGLTRHNRRYLQRRRNHVLKVIELTRR